jgi:hypothetical protein
LKSPADPSLRAMRMRARRAVTLLLVAAAALAVRAADVPDRAAAGALLDQFRRSIWAEPIYAEFDLRQMPRRGPERLYRGRFWGGRNEKGPVTRFELDGGPGGTARHLLIQGGPDSTVWSSSGSAPGVPDPAALLAPLVPGVEITPFDLLPMPYLYWLDAELTGVERVRGREGLHLRIFPPGRFFGPKSGHKGGQGVLGRPVRRAGAIRDHPTRDGHVAKTLSILELRKVGSRWIPKDVDVRNEATRDKTRLTLTAVAVGAANRPLDLRSGHGSARKLPLAKSRQPFHSDHAGE